MPQGPSGKAIVWRIYFQKIRYSCRQLKTPPHVHIITLQVLPPWVIHNLTRWYPVTLLGVEMRACG